MVLNPLDRDATAAFAQARYAAVICGRHPEPKDPLERESATAILELLRHAGKAPMDHAENVAYVAVQLAREHFHTKLGSFLPMTIRGTLEHLDHAALLHEAITLGATFDQVCDVTNPHVADLVAAVSYDNRLSGPRRCLERRGRLFEHTLPSHVLLLADILCTLADGAELFEQHDSVAVDEWLQLAVPELEMDLGALHEIRESIILAPQLRDADEQLRALAMSVLARIKARNLKQRIKAQIEKRTQAEIDQRLAASRPTRKGRRK